MSRKPWRPTKPWKIWTESGGPYEVPAQPARDGAEAALFRWLENMHSDVVFLDGERVEVVSPSGKRRLMTILINVEEVN